MQACLEAFTRLLKEKKLSFEFVDGDEGQVLVIPVARKELMFNVIVQATSELPDVNMRVTELQHIPIEKRTRALEEINAMHAFFRRVSFVLDDDNDVHVRVDNLQTSTPADLTLWETFVILVRVIEESHPRFMKLIWGD